MYDLDSTTSRTSSSTDLSDSSTIKKSKRRTYTITTSRSQQSSSSSSSHEGKGEGEGEGEIRLNPTTGRPLRNTTPYGRHSNDWLFGSVRIHKSIARKVKKVVRARTTRAGSEPAQ